MSRYHHDMGNCSTCFRMRVRANRSDENDLEKASILQPLASFVVRGIDFEIARNTKEHNTDRYYATRRESDARLVIRRGDAFQISVSFQRRYDKRDDLINLVFSVADAGRPSYSQNTEVVLPIIDDSSLANSLGPLTAMENAWTGRVASFSADRVTFQITPSGNAIIGEWKLRIETMSRSKGNQSKFVYESPTHLYILFNPWSKKDSVYMKDKEMREECVMNESGIIWRGLHDLLRPTPWIFSQFDENVLESCLYAIATIGSLSVAERNDPVKVSRHISAIVNSVDDNGIMVGNWSGDYSGGKAPTSWTGSFSIMNKFLKTKKPVKFGQCWVFAGITTTICRAIGIPSRPITNYQSAHDTHMSLTVDRFFDNDLETVDEKNADSIWNFHVWNEVWMTRPDLASSSYDGWQVIDATPQEQSDGQFRLGPASVEAVKRGDVIKPYDTKFVYAEVNADEVFWLHQGEKQPLKLLKHKTTTVGKQMSSKGVGSSSREDVTDSYKYKEKSREEREVMLKALRMCNNQFTSYLLNEKFEDIRFELMLLDDIVIGMPFTVRFKIRNRSDKVYRLTTVMDVRTTFYTGSRYSLVKKDFQEIKAAPRSEQEIVLDISYDEYEKHLIDQNSFYVSVLGNVLETQFQYHAADDFRVRMPDIKFEIEGDVIQGSPFVCNVFFTNPLPKALNRGMFRLEGAGLGHPMKAYLKHAVKPGEEASATFEITPQTLGEKTLSAKFESRELRDVDGFRQIRVAANTRTADINSNSITRN